MKTYHGYRRLTPSSTGEGESSQAIVHVCVNNARRELRMRTDIRNHSPTGPEWGYCGSGPAQLALALVADACGREFAVPPIYQRFKEEVVAGLAHDGWRLTDEQIVCVVARIASEIDFTPEKRRG